jgi:ketosteroid isomerase-like protein
MSNLVETVKEIYGAFGRGDLAGIMAHIADDVRWESEGPAEMGFTGIRNGKDEVPAFFAAIAQEHDDPKLAMADFVASGDSVACFGRYEATLKKTGRRVNSPIAHLFQFRDGKVVRYVGLSNTADFA